MCKHLDINKKAETCATYLSFTHNPDKRSIKAMLNTTVSKSRKPVQQTFFTPSGKPKAKKYKSKYTKKGKLRKTAKDYRKASWEKLSFEQRAEIIRMNKDLLPNNAIAKSMGDVSTATVTKFLDQ